jgi:hypothetical protein
MDITFDIIKRGLVEIGAPLTVTGIFLWIVIRVYLLTERKIIAYFERQTAAVERISTAVELLASVLDEVYASVTRILEGGGDHDENPKP